MPTNQSTSGQPTSPLPRPSQNDGNDDRHRDAHSSPSSNTDHPLSTSDLESSSPAKSLQTPVGHDDPCRFLPAPHPIPVHESSPHAGIQLLQQFDSPNHSGALNPAHFPHNSLYPDSSHWRSLPSPLHLQTTSLPAPIILQRSNQSLLPSQVPHVGTSITERLPCDGDKWSFNVAPLTLPRPINLAMSSLTPGLSATPSINGDAEDNEVDPFARLSARTLALMDQPESESTIYDCEYCDKMYQGKHARSIWRRHLSDKHKIPLATQPRRTRWDNDVNRPKTEEERRERTLESKRRWARKNRAAKKAARENQRNHSQSITSLGQVEQDPAQSERDSPERSRAPSPSAFSANPSTRLTEPTNLLRTSAHPVRSQSLQVDIPGVSYAPSHPAHRTSVDPLFDSYGHMSLSQTGQPPYNDGSVYTDVAAPSWSFSTTSGNLGDTLQYHYSAAASGPSQLVSEHRPETIHEPQCFPQTVAPHPIRRHTLQAAHQLAQNVPTLQHAEHLSASFSRHGSLHQSFNNSEQRPVFTQRPGWNPPERFEMGAVLSPNLDSAQEEHGYYQANPKRFKVSSVSVGLHDENLYRLPTNRLNDETRNLQYSPPRSSAEMTSHHTTTDVEVDENRSNDGFNSAEETSPSRPPTVGTIASASPGNEDRPCSSPDERPATEPQVSFRYDDVTASRDAALRVPTSLQLACSPARVGSDGAKVDPTEVFGSPDVGRPDVQLPSIYQGHFAPMSAQKRRASDHLLPPVITSGGVFSDWTSQALQTPSGLSRFVFGGLPSPAAGTFFQSPNTALTRSLGLAPAGPGAVDDCLGGLLAGCSSSSWDVPNQRP